jgi:hypothetical protein
VADILPCPFCGSTARMVFEHDADGISWIKVRCDAQSCHAEIPGKWHTPGNDCPQLYQEVRDMWNRRPDSSPPMNCK